MYVFIPGKNITLTFSLGVRIRIGIGMSIYWLYMWVCMRWIATVWCTGCGRCYHDFQRNKTRHVVEETDSEKKHSNLPCRLGTHAPRTNNNNENNSPGKTCTHKQLNRNRKKLKKNERKLAFVHCTEQNQLRSLYFPQTTRSNGVRYYFVDDFFCLFALTIICFFPIKWLAWTRKYIRYCIACKH